MSRVIGEDEAKNGKPLASIMAGRRCGVNNLCGRLKKIKKIKKVHGSSMIKVL